MFQITCYRCSNIFYTRSKAKYCQECKYERILDLAREKSRLKREKDKQNPS